MGDKPFVDDDDSVFKQHVLYVVPGDPNCERLQRMLDAHPVGDDVWVQNAREIPANRRPPWLNGVPILVSKESKQAHRGDNIYKYLKQWQNEDYNLMPANSFNAVSASGFDYQNFDAGDNVTSGFAGINQLGTYTLEDEQRPPVPGGHPNGAGTSGKDKRMQQAEQQTQQQTQRLMQQREEMDRAIMARNRQMGSIAR